MILFSTLILTLNLSSFVIAIDDIYISGSFPDITLSKGKTYQFKGYVGSNDSYLRKVTALISLQNGEKDDSLSEFVRTKLFDLSTFVFDSTQYDIGSYHIGIWAKSENVTDPQDPLTVFTVTITEPDISLSLVADNMTIKDTQVVNITAAGEYNGSGSPTFSWRIFDGEISFQSNEADNPNLIKWIPPDIDNEETSTIVCEYLIKGTDIFDRQTLKILVVPDTETNPVNNTDFEAPYISSIHLSKTKIILGDPFEIKWGAYDNVSSPNELLFHIQYSVDYTNWSDIKSDISNTNTYQWLPDKQLDSAKIRIKATDKAGNNSEWKETEEVFTVKEYYTEQPAAPELELYAINEKINPSILLKWKKILDSNKEHNADFYNIQCATDPETINQQSIVPISPEVPGKNIFEKLDYAIHSCNDNPITDDNSYYLQIQGVKNNIQGIWSDVKQITICIQDLPEFDMTFQVPENGMQNVSKTPILKWRAYDNDNDELDYYVTLGTDKNNLSSKRSFRSEYQGVTEYNVALENGKALLPGMTYFWQIWVRETGKTIENYGDEYIKSDIWSFTTELVGSDPAIVDVEQIGIIKPNNSVQFKIKIQNIGTETAMPQYIITKYIKNGAESPFLNGQADLKESLEPSQSAYVDIELFFRDRVFEKYGVTYDNILITGDSQIKFLFSYPDTNDISSSNNEFIKSISYIDNNRPEISYFNLHEFGSTSSAIDFFWARIGKELIISVGGQDDDALSRCVYSYRLNPESEWNIAHIEPYTLQYFSHAYPWLIPHNTPPTDTAQIRVQLYDKSENVSEIISDPFSIYSSNINAEIEPDKKLYQTGETLVYEISFSADNTVEYAKINLEAGAKTIRLKSFNPESSTSQFQWEIPQGYLSKNCYLVLMLTDNRGNENECRSEIFEIRANTQLPSPFNEIITLYNQEMSFPSDSMYRSQNQEIIFTQLDNNNTVHCIIEHKYQYYQDTANDYHEDTLIDMNNKYYVTYDTTLKQISSPIQIFDINDKVLDFILFDNKPFILFKKNNFGQLCYKYKDGDTFTSTQIIENQKIPQVTYAPKLDSSSDEYIALPGRCIYLNNFLWQNETFGTTKLWRYSYTNGNIGEGELLTIQNDDGSLCSMPHLNAATDGHDIYFIDDSGSKLVKFDTQQLIMNAYLLPFSLSDDREDIFKVALIAKNSNAYIVANGKVYQFNGSSVIEKADIQYTVNNEIVNYAQNNNWNNVDYVKAVQTENSIYVIIDGFLLGIARPGLTKNQEILKWNLSDFTFTKQICDTQNDIYKMPDLKSPESFDIIYVSDNKVIVAFGFDEEQASDLHNYHAFLKMLNLETGQVNYLGKLPFKIGKLDRITLINDNESIYAIFRNAETNQTDSYRIDLSNINETTRQIEDEDAQFIILDNKLNIIWGKGHAYDGTWNYEHNCLNNELLSHNQFMQIYPTAGDRFSISNDYCEGKLNTMNHYISSPKKWDVYVWDSGVKSIQKWLDLDHSNAQSLPAKFFQAPYISGFQKYNNPDNQIVLLKEDQSQQTISFSFQQNIAALFENEALFIGNKNSPTYQIVLSKYNYTSQDNFELVLNDTGNYIIEATSEKIDINQNKYVAIAWENFLAVGDLSRDFIIPEITFTHSEYPVEQGDILTLSWNASDNTEIKKFEIYKKLNDDSFTLLKTIEDVSMTTFQYEVNDSDDIMFRIVAYDLDNNTAFDTSIFKWIHPILFQSFSVNKQELGTGESLTFLWQSEDADMSTEYTICIKSVDQNKWEPLSTTKGGDSDSITVTHAPGEYEFRIDSEDDSLTLSHTVLITGEFVAFSSSEFSPAQTVYYAYDKIVDFKWGIEKELSNSVKYSVLIKLENDDSFHPIAQTFETSCQYQLPEPTQSFNWMVLAQYQGNDYASDEFYVEIQQLLPCHITSIELKDNHTYTPYIVINFEPFENAEQYEIARTDSSGNELKILLDNTYNRFTDTQIQYGEKYQYSISSILGQLKSENAQSETISITMIEPLGIEIQTPDYQFLDTNEFQINYSPTPDLCYEKYEIMFKTLAMTDFELFKITQERSVNFDNLLYNTKYFVKVQPLNYDNQKIGMCGIIQFTTGVEPLPSVDLTLMAETSNNTINLSWNINNESNAIVRGFEIERKSSDFFKTISKTQNDQTIYLDSDILTNVAYTYRIRAYNDGGYSDFSNEIQQSIYSDPVEKHFILNSGNPADHIWEIYLESASLDGNPLTASDEIAIFDSETLVGAFQLSQSLSSETVFDNVLTAWSTLSDGSGYQAGHTYTFKCWDWDRQQEYFGDVVFNDSYTDAHNSSVFPSEDAQYSIVSLNFYSDKSQVISLKEGYQLISFNVYKQQTAYDMFSDILNCIDFVRDTDGKMLRKIGPQWIDNIDEISQVEGFLVKMICPAIVNVSGKPVDLQTPIPLNSVYHLISYLSDESMQALEAFNSIHDNLFFVRNSNGYMLRKIGVQWVDNIKLMHPGEGYLVKMTGSDTLIYPVSDAIQKRNIKQPIVNAKESHHFPVISGNPVDHIWTIYFKNITINGISIKADDEIAIYDADKMVGSVHLTINISDENWQQQMLTVWSTLNNDNDGFIPGNEYRFKCWDNSKGIELDEYQITWTESEGYTGNNFPEGDGRYSIMSLDFNDNVSLNKIIILLKELVGIHSGIYPTTSFINEKIGLEDIISLLQNLSSSHFESN